MSRAIMEVYDEKREYVKKLSEALVPLTDFVSMDYAYSLSTQSEYLRVFDVFGAAFYVNVTGNSTEAILKEICKMVLGHKPTGLVTDKTALREIVDIFHKREAVA